MHLFLPARAILFFTFSAYCLLRPFCVSSIKNTKKEKNENSARTKLVRLFGGMQ